MAEVCEMAGEFGLDCGPSNLTLARCLKPKPQNNKWAIKKGPPGCSLFRVYPIGSMYGIFFLHVGQIYFTFMVNVVKFWVLRVYGGSLYYPVGIQGLYYHIYRIEALYCPVMWGFVINHKKDPYQTTNQYFMESIRSGCFFSWLGWIVWRCLEVPKNPPKENVKIERTTFFYQLW